MTNQKSWNLIKEISYTKVKISKVFYKFYVNNILILRIRKNELWEKIEEVIHISTKEHRLYLIEDTCEDPGFIEFDFSEREKYI